MVEPAPGFLQQVNELTHQHGGLVIYDEVITAFRFMYGGAQDYLDVYPDMTALGKIIGGGLPIGAYGGRADIMEKVAPRVYLSSRNNGRKPRFDVSWNCLFRCVSRRRCVRTPKPLR